MNNPELYFSYLLRKEEMQIIDGDRVEELMLYYVTTPEDAYRISRENIDWRTAPQSRFGAGVYFTPHPCYAFKYGVGTGGLFD